MSAVPASQRYNTAFSSFDRCGEGYISPVAVETASRIVLHVS